MIDPEIFFDQRPSHPARPDFVTKAQDAVDAAWKAADDAVERGATYAEIFDLQMVAVQAEVDYRTAYDQWMTAYEPSQYQEHAGAFLP